LLCCFQVNYQLEFYWLLNRQVGGFGSFENFVDVCCRTSEWLGIAR